MKNQNQKIKILFRHRSMEMGGVEKVLLSLLNNLDREKFEMTVLLNFNQGELRNEIPNHVRKVYLLDGREDLSNNSWVQKIQLVKRRLKLERLKKNSKIIDEKILREKYDVEIAMTYGDFEAVLNSSNKKSKKIGWFHSEIDVPKLQPAVPKIIKHFPQFDHMVYCSQRTKDLMHLHYPSLQYPPEDVIINAIPIEEIKTKSNEKITDFGLHTVPVFLSVGRLHTRKGFHKLMEAHHQLIQEGLLHKIFIAGSGEELENLLKQRKNLGVEETFEFLGNKMNPYPYIKNADFFILPSESEAWPLVLAEALLLQKPSIATDTGDVSTMIRDQETGLLINYSTEEIKNAMKKFLTEKDLVLKIQKNLENSEEFFDNKKIFSAVENIILNLLKK